MPLSWNEIKSRALAFSRTWADASDENSQAKPFWLALFFEIFGITDKRVATFELACGGKKTYKNDAERVAFLFDLYQRQTNLLTVAVAGKVGRRRKATSAREGG